MFFNTTAANTNVAMVHVVCKTETCKVTLGESFGPDVLFSKCSKPSLLILHLLNEELQKDV